MSNEIENEVQEAADSAEAIKALSIAALRNAAKTLNITAQRDWTKEDFVRAIQDKQKSDSVTNLVFDSNSAPRPGFARIMIHRDPTPNHKNSPIHVGFNGQLYQIPRGMEVDVPKEFVEVLRNARTTQVKQAEESSRHNPGGVYKDEEQTSYPFQVIAITPGQWKNPQDSRAASYAVREEFKNMHNAWPTEGELRDFKKARMNKQMS